MLNHPPHILALMRTLEIEKARTESLRSTGTPTPLVELEAAREGLNCKGYRFMCPCCHFENRMDYNPPEFIECTYCATPLQVSGIADQFRPPPPLTAGDLPSTGNG